MPEHSVETTVADGAEMRDGAASPTVVAMAPTPSAADRGSPVVPGLTVAAVARRLGVAPATLRTWDRRYGLGPSSHTAGSHRRYTAEDVARLEIMRALVFQGAAPADAARAALDADVSAPDPVTSVEHVAAAPLDAARAHEAAAVDPAATDPFAPVADRTRAGGGRIVALHGGSPQARGLARAALALDAPAIRRIVSTSLAEHGTIETWDHLIAPVLIGVGERFQSTGQGVDLEHLLSEGIVGALRDVAHSVPESRTARPVLLACAPDDMHTLPLHAVAAALAERGIPSRMLGARLPIPALVDAVRRCGPPAVMLWSHDAVTGDPSVLAQVPTMRPATTLVLGGPGWPADLPPGIVRVGDLTDAVTRLATAVRGLG